MAGADYAGVSRLQYPANTRVNPHHVLGPGVREIHLAGLCRRRGGGVGLGLPLWRLPLHRRPTTGTDKAQSSACGRRWKRWASAGNALQLEWISAAEGVAFPRRHGGAWSACAWASRPMKSPKPSASWPEQAAKDAAKDAAKGTDRGLIRPNRKHHSPRVRRRGCFFIGTTQMGDCGPGVPRCYPAWYQRHGYGGTRDGPTQHQTWTS